MSSTASARSPMLLGKPFAIALLSAFVVLAIAGVGWRVSRFPFSYFTRDPAAITHQAPYMGMVSFFGLFAWAVAATALVGGGYLASLRGAYDRRNAFFVAAAAVVYLLFDDTFQFHEYVYPVYLHLPDSVVQFVYVAVVVFAVVKGRRFLVSTNFGLLVAAGVFLGISIAFDAFAHQDLVEDGSKLIGIFLLTAYCLDTALAESRRTFDHSRASAAES